MREISFLNYIFKWLRFIIPCIIGILVLVTATQSESMQIEYKLILILISIPYVFYGLTRKDVGQYDLHEIYTRIGTSNNFAVIMSETPRILFYVFVLITLLSNPVNIPIQLVNAANIFMFVPLGYYLIFRIIKHEKQHSLPKNK